MKKVLITTDSVTPEIITLSKKYKENNYYTVVVSPQTFTEASEIEHHTLWCSNYLQMQLGDVNNWRALDLTYGRFDYIHQMNPAWSKLAIQFSKYWKSKAFGYSSSY